MRLGLGVDAEPRADDVEKVVDVVKLGFGVDEESKADDVEVVDCLIKRAMLFHRECCSHGRMFSGIMLWLWFKPKNWEKEFLNYIRAFTCGSSNCEAGSFLGAIAIQQMLLAFPKIAKVR